MLLSSFIKESAASLEGLYPPEEAAGIIAILLEDRLHVQRYTHILEPSREIPEDRLESLLADMQKLRAAQPIQYVVGKAPFRSHTFKVGPGVLVPRPETEQIVDIVRSFTGNRPARVLDLCTGSGCIAWSIAAECPGAHVYGVDISLQALEIARGQNLELTPMSRVEFIQADILQEGALDFDEPFDVIVSNPPYIMDSEKVDMRPNVLDHEPHIALFVRDSDPLLFYRAVADLSSRLLRSGGQGVVEINEKLSDPTAELFCQAGFEKVEKIPDYFNKTRFVAFKKGQ